MSDTQIVDAIGLSIQEILRDLNGELATDICFVWRKCPGCVHCVFEQDSYRSVPVPRRFRKQD